MSLKMRFEQVPLEFVKKLLEKQADGKQKESSMVVVFKSAAKKTEPYTLPQLRRERRIPSESGGNAASELQNRVKERFGVLPNFFRLAPETPEITEKLWGFAQAAYLDNPLPSIFKERLFVHLSRFCSVRYCIARHAGFLVGLGRPAGDKDARAETVGDVVKLLRRPIPRGAELKSCLSFCSKCPAPLIEMPTADTQMEDGLFSLASHVFLQTADAPECLEALERLLGTVRFQYLLLFLT